MAGWLTAFKMIPWGEIVENAPTVVRGATRLWEKLGGRPPAQSGEAQEPAPSSTLEQKVAALEQELAEQREQAARTAGLITKLAEQDRRLIQVVDILRARVRLLYWACGALAIAVVAIGVMLMLRAT